MSKLLLKKSREFSAVTLIVGAIVLLSFIFVDPSHSASPVGGTLNPTGPTITWGGFPAPAVVGAVALDETACVEGTNCDKYALKLSGTPADWAGKKARIVISWANVNSDFDVFIHKGTATLPNGVPSGPIVGSSATGAPSPEVVELDPSVASIGTGDFLVSIVYFLVDPGVSYNGEASVLVGVAPTPTPSPGSTPTPAPALPGTPRYHTFTAPPGFGEDAGEPSIGSNWLSENVVRAGSGHTFSNSQNAVLPNGGTANYYGGFLTDMLRITFDDCSSPANAYWEKRPLLLAATPRGLGDPILFTDNVTGRTFVSQEEGQAGSTTDVTDNDGQTFMPSQGAGAPAGIDHQTVGSGPFRGTPPATATYPATGGKRAVYYASQSVTDARTSRSDDGGITFGPAIPMYTTAQCGGLHGHIKVTPATPATLANGHSGTVYVPNNACGGTEPLGHADGQQAAIVSEDNGITWSVRPIPNSDTKSDRDPSIGIATDGTVYMGMQSKDGHARIAVTHDKGITWSTPLDVGVASASVTGPPVGGINNMVFAEVVAGDPNRASFAFFGTTTAGDNYDCGAGGCMDDLGNVTAPEFTGVWYLYIASTFDGGATWTTVNVNPNDPIQRGGICGGGDCRNLLDFFDATLDKEGRVLIGGEDGCIGACVNGGANSFTAKAFITRQAGGKRMFAAFDPATTVVPGAPSISGTLTGSTVNLSWTVPDNGGAEITSYKVFKGSGATFSLIATVNVPTYTDPAFNAGEKYRVTAVNSAGEGPFCKEFAPVAGAPVVTACSLPGILVINDQKADGTDNDGAQNTPADPRVNIKDLFVAEPFIAPGTEQLIFTVQVAPSTAGSAPANSQYLTIWERQRTQASDANDAKFDRLYVAMVTDAAGTPRFEYGKFGIPINTMPPPLPDPSANAPVKFGDADSGSYNPLTGVIRIAVSNSKFRTIDGGATKYTAGTFLAGINVRTYFNRPDYNSDPNSTVRSQRSQNNASDITDNSSYQIAGNNACAPTADLVSAVSRKVHTGRGPIDIRLFPALAAAKTECRSGGTNGDYQVVITFASPVTFDTPTTDSGSITSMTVNGNVVTLNLTGVQNARTTTITLPGTSAGGASSTVSVPLPILVGDTNDDGFVNSGDTTQTRSRSGQLASDAEGGRNFRSDVNTDGTINSGDTTAVRSRSGTALSSPSAALLRESR